MIKSSFSGIYSLERVYAHYFILMGLKTPKVFNVLPSFARLDYGRFAPFIAVCFTRVGNSVEVEDTHFSGLQRCSSRDQTDSAQGEGQPVRSSTPTAICWSQEVEGAKSA